MGFIVIVILAPVCCLEGATKRLSGTFNGSSQVWNLGSTAIDDGLSVTAP